MVKLLIISLIWWTSYLNLTGIWFSGNTNCSVVINEASLADINQQQQKIQPNQNLNQILFLYSKWIINFNGTKLIIHQSIIRCFGFSFGDLSISVIATFSAVVVSCKTHVQLTWIKAWNLKTSQWFTKNLEHGACQSLTYLRYDRD